MALYEMTDEKFEKIKEETFSNLKITERNVLQQFLKNQIDVLSLDLLVIAEEYSDWEDSKRRIDLLAIDKEGNLVVIEIKRNKDNSYMDLQALRYAAMVSTSSIQDVIKIYKDHFKNVLDHEKSLADHLGCNKEELLNEEIKTVKIVLVNEDFLDKELTSTVMWLVDNYDLDITCIRMVPYKHGKKNIVDVQQIIPLKEASEYQIKIRQKKIVEKTNKNLKVQYEFNGEIYYTYRSLVFAVTQKYFSELGKISFEEFKDLIPHKFYKKTKDMIDKDRFFSNEDEIFKLVDCEIAVRNQWSKNNIDEFIEFFVKKVGYEIKKL